MPSHSERVRRSYDAPVPHVAIRLCYHCQPRLTRDRDQWLCYSCAQAYYFDDGVLRVKPNLRAPEAAD